jgi:hypothetical protein
MWSGFPPELQRELDSVRRLAALTRQTPTKEWPLVFLADYDLLLVVREWPNGEMTAYATSEYSGSDAGRRPQ